MGLEKAKYIFNCLIDVFLTTLKPQQRIVTAHDVASSLYFFHLDSVHDEEIRDVLGLEQEFQRAGQKAKGKENSRPPSGEQSPKRKPLPSTPHLDTRNGPEHLQKAYPNLRISLDLQRGRPPLARKPISGNIQDAGLIANGTESPVRKLLGPRPLHSRNQSVDAAIPSAIPNEEMLLPRRYSECPPALLPKLDHRVELEPYKGVSQTNDFSVTMIRRDPGSGGQWNVGRIASGPIPNMQSENLLPPRSPQPVREQGLLLEITNAGYNKFIGSEPVVRRPEPASVDYTSAPQDIQRHSLVSRDSNRYSSFNRYLFLEQPRSRSNGLSPSRGEFRSSIDSVRSTQDATRTSPYPSPQFSPPYTRPYTFLSPWNGTCEFSAGLAGRSLKCRHVLPSLSSGSGVKESSSTRTVSDLRFNLPSSKLLDLFSHKRSPLTMTDSKRSSFFGYSHGRRNSVADQQHEAEDSDDEEDERMDLSLGQERAGGGMRGKEAKLGKLIVEDEGLKMLDLVVAANMGVWWSVYGRNTS